MVQQGPDRADSQTSLALWAVALAALLWAIGAAVASGLFDDGVSPLQLTAARASIAAVGLFYWRSPKSDAQPSTRLVLALGTSIALVTATYYLAIDRLPVAVAIVLQYTAPVMVVLYGAAAARKRPATDVIVAALVAFSGVVFVSEFLEGELGSIDTLGLLFGLGSAVFFASYTILGERVGARLGPRAAMFRAFGLSAIFWILILVPQGWPAELFEPWNLIRAIYIGIAGTLVPFLLYIWAIEHVRPAGAATPATLEPLFAAMLAWSFLGQSLSALQIGGGVLILGAVVFLQTRQREPLIVSEI